MAESLNLTFSPQNLLRSYYHFGVKFEVYTKQGIVRGSALNLRGLTHRFSLKQAKRADEPPISVQNPHDRSGCSSVLPYPVNRQTSIAIIDTFY